MEYHFNLHRDEDTIWAEGIELPTCMTQGDTITELRLNLSEALDGFLDEPVGTNMTFPDPDKNIKPSDDILAIEVSPNIAFALQVRKIRLDKRLSQAEMQKKLGFKSRTSYTRLESTRCNPSLTTIQKVFDVFPDFPIAEIFLQYKSKDR